MGRDGPRSLETTRDGPRLLEMTRDGPRSLEIARDRSRSLEIRRSPTTSSSTSTSASATSGACAEPEEEARGGALVAEPVWPLPRRPVPDMDDPAFRESFEARPSESGRDSEVAMALVRGRLSEDRLSEDRPIAQDHPSSAEISRDQPRSASFCESLERRRRRVRRVSGILHGARVGAVCARGRPPPRRRPRPGRVAPLTSGRWPPGGISGDLRGVISGLLLGARRGLERAVRLRGNSEATGPHPASLISHRSYDVMGGRGLSGATVWRVRDPSEQRCQ